MNPGRIYHKIGFPIGTNPEDRPLEARKQPSETEEQAISGVAEINFFLHSTNYKAT